MEIIGKTETMKPPDLMNIGNNHPVTVNELVEELEAAIRRRANVDYLPMQPGDVEMTFADIDLINSYCDFNPHINLKTSLKNFCDWFLIFKGQKREIK